MDSDDPEGQQRRRKMPRTASNNNNTIVNSTTDAPEATSTDAAATTSPTWLTADGEQSGSLVHRDASPAESRSCENCRRSKLKCSRTHPCTKCVAKNIQCIYEQVDKKRGPRPGYVEEIYRRIDMLEHMIVGQSLLRDHGRPDPPNEGTQSLLEIFAEERARLLDLSQTEPTDIMQPASSRGSVSRVKMDGDGQDEYVSSLALSFHSADFTLFYNQSDRDRLAHALQPSAAANLRNLPSPGPAVGTHSP